MPTPASACVVDASAMVAIRFAEPEAEALAVCLGAFSHRIMPPSCIVEFCMLRRFGDDLPRWVANFLDEYEIAVLPMSAEIAWIAASAAARFGRGSGHPAGLNFGDCMSYAFARHLGAPLLFKGDDFTRTDIVPALEQRA